MRNFYVFLNYNGTGWQQSDTIWHTKADAIDAMMWETRADGVDGIIGYDDDKLMLRIPDSIDAVPEN
jgi:hypothetical protein